jgi:rsbT antagonist protein RsbS
VPLLPGIGVTDHRAPLPPGEWTKECMAVPILKQRHHLIASIQSALTDQDLLGLRDDLARLVGQHRALGVIIDVTALDVLDSFATRTLRNIAYMTKLRGAETVIVGIQPDVALAMVQLGLTLEDVLTALDLEEGMALLDTRLEESHGSQ